MGVRVKVGVRAWMGVFVMGGAVVAVAQAPPYIWNNHATMDEGCRVLVMAQPGDKPGVQRVRKMDALCQRTKDKDVDVRQSMMWKGEPRVVGLTVREMSYLLQNPTQEPVTYTFIYHLKRGHHIDPNGGPKPVKLSEEEAVWEVKLGPGQGTHLDLADRSK